MTIEGPIQLDATSRTAKVLKQASELAKKRALEVTVPSDVEPDDQGGVGIGGTGQGGTLLLLLAAKDKRWVAPDSTITGLDQQLVAQLTQAGLCEGVCKQAAKGDFQGKLLLDQKLAAKPAESDGSGGLLGGPLTFVLIAVLAAGLLVIAFLVVRRSPTPRPASGPPTGPAPNPPVRHAQPTHTPPRTARHPTHQAASAAGPRVTAVLRTDLHPQGYVELDHCLFRAAWCDADVPPPALGEPVEVVKGSGRDAGLLLAYPPGTGR